MTAIRDIYEKHKQNVANSQRQAQTRTEKKEAKRLAKLDTYLTNFFNQLADNDQITINALIKKDGEIKHSVGGVNNVKEFFKTGFGLTSRSLGNITPENIEANAAYQSYKDKLDKQGFDLEITGTKGSEAAAGIASKCFGAGYSAFMIPTAMAAPYFIPLLVPGAFFIGYGFTLTTNFTMKIKEKKPVPLLEYKPVEGDMSYLLSELNQVQEKEKVPIATETKKNTVAPLIK